MTTPQPLLPSSPKLRDWRYEVDILGPKNERGGRPTIATGRFVTIGAAKSWADETYPDAEYVNITFYSARNGWVAQRAAQRTADGWSV